MILIQFVPVLSLCRPLLVRIHLSQVSYESRENPFLDLVVFSVWFVHHKFVYATKVAKPESCIILVEPELYEVKALTIMLNKDIFYFYSTFKNLYFKIPR
jgi:hypothetical protein